MKLSEIALSDDETDAEFLCQAMMIAAKHAGYEVTDFQSDPTSFIVHVKPKIICNIRFDDTNQDGNPKGAGPWTLKFMKDNGARYFKMYSAWELRDDEVIPLIDAERDKIKEAADMEGGHDVHTEPHLLASVLAKLVADGKHIYCDIAPDHGWIASVNPRTRIVTVDLTRPEKGEAESSWFELIDTDEENMELVKNDADHYMLKVRRGRKASTA